MDIKEQINKIVTSVQQDPAMLKQFQSDPVKVVENLFGVDLPDDVVDKVIAGVKSALAAGTISDALGSLKKLF